jgi:lipopolysaccharide/colanic/teichoic acid biosynthesis glycosyltransferase
LISPTETPPGLSWSHPVEALNRARRDTDVVGWFEQGEVIGLIRSHLDIAVDETEASLETTVRRDLERCLGPHASQSYRVRSHVYSPHAGAVATPILKAAERPGRRVGKALQRAAKRGLDIAGSLALLAVCWPAFLVIAALVKCTSKGPVFFPQERVGQRAIPFRMLKFRTMRVDAGHEIHQQYVTQYIHGRAASESASAGAPPVFKIVGDPRVTKVGSFLRRSSLDEIPQFLNVLRGDMSLVGPRPPLPYEVKCYKPWHRRRVLDAKPGITGLWQVTGRSRTTFDEMVRLDIRYARTPSVWTDLKILLATPRAVISGNGAH